MRPSRVGNTRRFNFALTVPGSRTENDCPHGTGVVSAGLTCPVASEIRLGGVGSGAPTPHEFCFPLPKLPNGSGQRDFSASHADQSSLSTCGLQR